jgi:hypothetical protein
VWEDEIWKIPVWDQPGKKVLRFYLKGKKLGMVVRGHHPSDSPASLRQK